MTQQFVLVDCSDLTTRNHYHKKNESGTRPTDWREPPLSAVTDRTTRVVEPVTNSPAPPAIAVL
ncbi:hypothetical protein [Desulfofustis glycolicus]|uniref:hypothetical protein n=1 Tax=Desulfofustis glycolicus TaxID=51195 RepID=UPI000932EE38|nr:hypothetical protein [Desulfofustis glycolicus]